MMKISAIIVLLLHLSSALFSQVSINSDNSQPDPSAGLEVKFTDKGFLPPRVALTAIDSPDPITTPATGLMVYNTATAGTPPNNVAPGYYRWNGIRWVFVEIPQGTNIGDMLYWNGTQWVSIPVGTNGQVLTLNNGIPCWGGIQIPILNTSTISSITISTAISGGTISSDGGSPVIARGVCWSTSPNPTTANSKTNNGTGTGTFTSNITGLTLSTTYYVRAYATNSIGTSYGNELSFTTKNGIISLTTTAVSAINSNSATGGGNITNDGGSSVTGRGVCWSTSINPTTANSHTSDGIGTGAFSSSLTGLAPNTLYYVRAWATNSVGTIYGNEVSFTTLLSCGTSITINHVSGSLAPITKTVTYGTVTNIPGETSKCWITSNLGADHQAAAVDDATEASAGWYWQFNRKQGYMHDGTTVTPAWTITYINESNDWQTANDPCTITFGVVWHIPTITEWSNIDNSGNWIEWNGPWNSDLKIHAAGSLGSSDGSLGQRGLFGYYWSNSQIDSPNGKELGFNNGWCSVSNSFKANAFTLRCIRNL